MPSKLKTGTNDLVITRLGWRWTPTPNLLVDAHAAFVSTSFAEDNAARQQFNRSRDREWSGGTNVSWSWRPGMILQAGYSLRRPLRDSSGIFLSAGQPPLPFSSHSSDVRQNAYLQHSAQLWRDRLRFQGGVRSDKLDTLRTQPLTGQLSLAYQATRTTQVEAGWGRYAQLPISGNILGAANFNGIFIGFAQLPQRSSQYVLAVEQRLGERSRFRVEAFDRQNEQRTDFFLLPARSLLQDSALVRRDYSRGVQFLLQRRSENRLSGWIGYTLTYAQARFYIPSLPAPISFIGKALSYAPTLQDQRHTVNIFASYRLKPTVRFSAKALYGSGFPVDTSPPIVRLGTYERLDLRADKSWLFRRWKLSLYGELLNATNHNNRRFDQLFRNSTTGQTVLFTFDGIPATPTVGLAFDF